MTTTYRRRPSDLDRDARDILAVLARIAPRPLDLDPLDPYNLNEGDTPQ